MENYETDTEEDQESVDDEVDLVIDQKQVQPAQMSSKTTTDCMISENMLGSIPGSIITLQNMNIFAKFVKFFIVITHARLVKEEEHGLTTLFS